MILCVEFDNTGESRCDTVTKELKLEESAPRWLNGKVHIDQSPELRHFLKGRLSTNVLVDRDGKILHSRIAPTLVDDVLRKALR